MKTGITMATIPAKYKSLLQGILNLIETETGCIYQMTLNKYGDEDGTGCVIGDINEREIEVYDMDSSDTELEGTYDTQADLFTKLCEDTKYNNYKICEDNTICKEYYGMGNDYDCRIKGYYRFTT